MYTRRNNTGDGLSGKLGGMMEALAPVLGDTPAGSKFVMKALNPSSQLVSDGIPDFSASQSIPWAIETLIDIEPPKHATGADICDFIIHLNANPIAPIDVMPTTRAAPTDFSSSFTYLNPILPDATPTSNPPLPAVTGLPANRWPETVATTLAHFQVKLADWRRNVQWARMTHFGVTLEQSAGDDSAQGFLTAGQIQQAPTVSIVADPTLGTNVAQEFYEDNDFSTASNIINNTRSYSGKAKEGCYVPLNLANNFAEWKNQSTRVVTLSTTIGATTGVYGAQPVPQKFVAIPNGTSNIGSMDENMGAIYIRGSVGLTSYRIRLRMGFELRGFPKCSYQPFLKDAPVYDEMAMKAYSRLKAELTQDGYPADYNMFGMLAQLFTKAAPYLLNFAKGGLGALMGNKDAGFGDVVRGGIQGVRDYRDRQGPPKRAAANTERRVVFEPKRPRVEEVDDDYENVD